MTTRQTQIDVLGAACRARGIHFSFLPDAEEDT